MTRNGTLVLSDPPTRADKLPNYAIRSDGCLTRTGSPRGFLCVGACALDAARVRRPNAAPSGLRWTRTQGRWVPVLVVLGSPSGCVVSSDLPLWLRAMQATVVVPMRTLPLAWRQRPRRRHGRTRFPPRRGHLRQLLQSTGRFHSLRFGV
jgi:hypothetical protein